MTQTYTSPPLTPLRLVPHPASKRKTEAGGARVLKILQRLGKSFKQHDKFTEEDCQLAGWKSGRTYWRPLRSINKGGIGRTCWVIYTGRRWQGNWTRTSNKDITEICQRVSLCTDIKKFETMEYIIPDAEHSIKVTRMISKGLQPQQRHY